MPNQSLLRGFFTILAVGIVTGVLTSLGQTYLPVPFSQFANSYSVWLLASFITGYLLRSYRASAIAGALVGCLALAGYYGLTLALHDAGFNMASNIIWLLGGTVVGPMAGLAGQLYHRKSRYMSYAIGFMTAIIVSEACYMFLVLHYIAQGWCFVALALLFWLVTHLAGRRQAG